MSSAVVLLTPKLPVESLLRTVHLVHACFYNTQCSVPSKMVILWLFHGYRQSPSCFVRGYRGYRGYRG